MGLHLHAVFFLGAMRSQGSSPPPLSCLHHTSDQTRPDQTRPDQHGANSSSGSEMYMCTECAWQAWDFAAAG
ncbi:uncharacterized protein RCO7_15245 [Rhynchosporium graminicola]|uniref:Uncharacterized protein n=1 Tax=Rhynchosporium graminicola TaxID=2792576 RepID=A0A1E1LSJ7_9HELO|nr:uncharacterized protein RCO7_15245 [Rhynchosporium commune]